MTHPNPSTALARVVVDELARAGVGLMVISPGSRSAALAIAAVAHPGLATRIVIDERSAAFHALGAARATGGPVAVLSTSGTAPANFFPAVVEADMSCLPLIVVSADRPAEMQGVGANQTIDQIGLFGTKVRGQATIEAPEHDRDLNREWRTTVSGLLTAATGSQPGPVHLNVRFREPTVPVTDDGRTEGEVYPHETPPLALEHEGSSEPTPDEFPTLAPDRGLIIAGDGEYDRDELAAHADRLGWPLLATALSGMRGGPVVAGYHHLLANGVPDDLRPETVVAVGAIGPSPRLESLVDTATTRVRIDRWGRVIDPNRNASARLRGDVNALLSMIGSSNHTGWRETWLDAAKQSDDRVAGIVAESAVPTGPTVAAALDEVDWGALVVASSLPIRDVDAQLRRPGPVHANRGASGIDGFVSTALGVAGVIPRTLALAGDLSVLHDSNGFLHDDDIDLVLVVVDNGGGGLFDLLPQASHAPDYERLFVTPHHRSFEALARLHDLRYVDVPDTAALIEEAGRALDQSGVDLIRVAVDRAEDLRLRAQLDG